MSFRKETTSNGDSLLDIDVNPTMSAKRMPTSSWPSLMGDSPARSLAAMLVGSMFMRSSSLDMSRIVTVKRCSPWMTVSEIDIMQENFEPSFRTAVTSLAEPITCAPAPSSTYRRMYSLCLFAMLRGMRMETLRPMTSSALCRKMRSAALFHDWMRPELEVTMKASSVVSRSAWSLARSRLIISCADMIFSWSRFSCVTSRRIAV
mmetsp:Transcript_6062/g.14682  ORF Transcript_6062/g.14682 Transcript_6062/m.14682 type:complete len:205 (-) Transcript_6062:351-965(-)